MQTPENNTALSELKPTEQSKNNSLYYFIGVVSGLSIFMFLGGLISNITGPYIGLPTVIIISWLFCLLLGWILQIEVIQSDKTGESTIMAIMLVNIFISCFSGWILVGMEKPAIIYGMIGGFCVGSFCALIIGSLFNGDAKLLLHERANVKFTKFYIGSGIGALIGGLLGGFIGSLISKIVI